MVKEKSDQVQVTSVMRLLSQLKLSALLLNRRVKLLEIIHHLWVDVIIYDTSCLKLKIQAYSNIHSGFDTKEV